METEVWLEFTQLVGLVLGSLSTLIGGGFRGLTYKEGSSHAGFCAVGESYKRKKN
jgi:hypothetical protein